MTDTMGRSSPPSGTTIDVNSSKNISCEVCEVLAQSSMQRPTITWHLLNYSLISSLEIFDGLFPGVLSVSHSSDGYESTLTFARIVKEFDGAILTCSVDNRRISSFPFHFKGKNYYLYLCVHVKNTLYNVICTHKGCPVKFRVLLACPNII